MKKLILSLSLIVLLILAFAACDNGSTGGNAGGNAGGNPGENGGNAEHTHAFGEWSTTKQPTNTETGTQERVCKCGAKETETLLARWSLGLACYKNSSTQTCIITGMGTCIDQEVVIPESIDGYKVTSIGASAFNNCDNITKVTIPEGVIEIGPDAFNDCDGLVSVTIPTSVIIIGKSAFDNCTSHPGVYITDLAAWCGISFGDTFANPAFYGHRLYLNGTLVTDAVIPDGVNKIGDYAFFCNYYLESISIPASVTSFGDRALWGLDKLKAVYFGGTKQQWNQISKPKVWYDLSGNAFIVYCTDGIITID